MAGTELNEQAHTPRHRIALGAIVGGLLVALIAGALGALIRDLAHPLVLIAFAALGAVLGAYAWGVAAYEREHMHSPEPGEEPESGLGWLWRRHAASFARLPLTPWI